MNPSERIDEEFLRRALHAAADPVEPAGDGLDKIRRRLNEPWLKQRTWLWRNGWENLTWLLRVQAEPLSERLRTSARGLALRGAMWAAALERIGVHFEFPAAAPRRLSAYRRPAPAHRQQSGPRVLPGAAWIRPAIAVAATVGIVVAGVYTLGQLRQTVVEITQWNGAPVGPVSRVQPVTSHRHPPASRSASPGSSTPAASSGSSPTPTASPTCSPTPSASPTSSPTPSPTPTPTPTPSPAPTPTPTPTPTDSPGVGMAPGSESLLGALLGPGLLPGCVQPGPLFSARSATAGVSPTARSG